MARRSGGAHWRKGCGQGLSGSALRLASRAARDAGRADWGTAMAFETEVQGRKLHNQSAMNVSFGFDWDDMEPPAVWVRPPTEAAIMRLACRCVCGALR